MAFIGIRINEIAKKLEYRLVSDPILMPDNSWYVTRPLILLRRRSAFSLAKRIALGQQVLQCFGDNSSSSLLPIN